VIYRLVLFALCAASLGGTPALAFKNIEGCDLVAFAAPSSPVPIPEERWQAYRDAAKALLGDASQDVRSLALALIDAQANLLAPDKESQAYQDYLGGDSCRILTKLNNAAIETLLGEVSQSLSGEAMTALRQVVDAALRQMDNLDRSARFRSVQDRTLALASYNCFVAATILALLPPEKRASLTLADFGDTAPCKDAGRTG
jgi:hypothetical protein